MSKGLEAFRDILGILSAVSGCEVDMNSERIQTITKELKALEIIEKKNVNVYDFKRDIIQLSSFTYRYYVNNFGYYHNGFAVSLLDEDEFDTLKEVLSE